MLLLLIVIVLKVNPVFDNGSKILPKNAPHCPLLCNRVFDDFILVYEVFSKALQSFETCVLVNNIHAKNHSPY